MAGQKDDVQEVLRGVASSHRRGIYEHHKGGAYCLYSFSVHESLLVPLFHYYSLTRRLRWTRELLDWTALVDKEGSFVPRFRFLRPATREEMIEAADLAFV